MRRASAFACILVGAATLCAPRSARAEGDGDVTRAAAEYEAGRRAYQDKRFGDAAQHFESAFSAVPSSQALRNAIRMRREAKELDKAANLAALGEHMYQSDPPTLVFVRDILNEANNKLTRVDVTCTPGCLVRVDDEPVSPSESPETQQKVYLRSGTRNVEVRFPGKGTQVKSFEAKAGKQEEWKVEPDGEEGGKGEKGSTGGGKGDKDKKKAEEDGLPKGVFYGGVVVSVLLAGITVGSYVDMKRVEKEELSVTADCAASNADPDCYPTGATSKSARTRTYIVGATTFVAIAGTAVIGMFFTKWGSSDPPRSSSGNSRLSPGVVPLRDGAAFSLSGSF